MARLSCSGEVAPSGADRLSRPLIDPGVFTDDGQFIDTIEEELHADPDATFFLATDNAATQRWLLEHPVAHGRTVVYQVCLVTAWLRA